jgi:PAS domain S-box-containing protein
MLGGHSRMSRLAGRHPRWLVAIAAVGAVIVVLGLMVWVEGDSRAAGQLLVSALFLPAVMMTVRWSEDSTSPAVSSRPLMATPKVVERSDADTDDGYRMARRSKPSLKTTLDTILSSTRQLVPYDVAEITLWDEERQCCVTHGWGGDPTYSQQAGGTYYLDEGYTGWIIRQRRFLLVRDVQARHDVRPKLDTEEYPFRSYIGIPLEIQGRFVGTVELASYQKDAWSERDLEVLQAMANQAVVAIENAYLYAETQRHAEQQTRLAHIATLAGSTLDLDELLDRVMGEALRLLEAEKGMLLLYDEEQDALVARYLASAGADRETVEVFHISASVEGFERSIFARGGSYFCNDPEDDPNIIPAYRDHIRAMGVQNFAGVALRLKERSIGELYLADRRGGFGREEVRLLRTVAGHFASAVENARLYDEMRRRVSELTSLTAISAAVSESLELERVLQIIASAILDVVGCQRSAIFVVDEERQVLRLAMTQGLSEEYEAQSQVLTLEHGGRAHAAATREPLIVSDVQADDSLLAFAPMSVREGFRAFADLPLKRADRVIGMLSAVFVEPHTFSEMEVDLLTAFADQAAIAIENARLYTQADEELRRREEALRQRHHELSTLYEAAMTTSSSLSLDAVLQTVADQMTRLLDSSGCALSLWNRERNTVETLVDYSMNWAQAFDTVYDLIEYPATRHVLESRRPMVIQRDDPAADPAELALMEEQGIYTLLMLPLIARDRVLGLAELIDEREARNYTPEEIRLAQGLAAQAAIAIENARLYEQAQQEISERGRAEEALQRLQRVSREMNATLDHEHILHIVLQEASRQSQTTHGAIMLQEAESGRLRLDVCVGYSEAEQAHIRDQLQGLEVHPALAKVLRTNKSLLIPDEDAEGDSVSTMSDVSGLGRTDACSMLIVPILYQETLAGLITLESTESRAFDRGILEFVEGLSAQAATAIGNAQRYQEELERGELLRRRADRLAAVLEVSRALRSDRPLEGILEEIAYAIQESVGFYMVLISKVDGDPPYQQRVAATGVPIAAFERLREVRDPWSVVADLMTAEFRVSRSYYIPAERQAHWRGRIDVYEEGISSAEREPGRWHPQDLLLVPLIGPGGDVQGLLSVDQPVDGRIPSRETVEALEIFAAQAALAIENARLVETLQRRAETLTLFNEVSRAATAHLETVELSDVLNTVVEIMPRLLQADYGSIFLLDAESGQYSPRAAYGLDFGSIASFSFSSGEGLVGAVTQSGVPLAVGDVKSDVRAASGFLGADMASVVLAPLTVGGQVMGVLNVGRREPVAFSTTEVATLSALADQVAVAVENARLFDQVRRFSYELERRVEDRTRALAAAMRELTEERDRVETLYRITSQLSVSLDLDHVLNLALRLVVDAVEAERASILMLDSGSDKLIYRAALGADEKLPLGGVTTRFSRGEGLAGWVMEQREAVIVPDVREDPRWIESRSGREQRYRSALAVPLVVSDEVLGALLLFHTQPDHFEEGHLFLVETAAIQVAHAISNAELYRLIFDQAEQLGNTLKAQRVEATKSQAILEGVADGVIVADADGEVILFNAAAERILELSREKALGHSINEMLGLYGSQAREWMEKVAVWAKQADTYIADEYTDEYLAARLEIGGRVVSVHLAPVLLENEFLGTVSAFRDVTAEVAAERAKTDFVSTVSHELRTPMTSIKGYVDLLLIGAVGALTKDQRHFLSVISANVDRLTLLVNDLLDISRMESGRMTLSPRAMHVVDIVDHVITTMQARASIQGLTLRTDVPSALPAVMADPDRVAQVLTNLLANACNYTLSGGEVTISACADGDQVSVSVHDTGIGIAPEDQEKIFNRFFRADDSVVQEAPGAGLGLSIVQSLVEMHGGRVWVESQVGKGSTFTFTLPMAKVDRETILSVM